MPGLLPTLLRRLILAALLALGLSAPARAESAVDPAGFWCLTDWTEPEFPGHRFEGWMRIAADGRSGEFYIKNLSSGNYARQSLVVSATGEGILAVGTILEAEFWNADRLMLRYDGPDRLLGGGVDVREETFTARFDRRASCDQANS